MKEPILSREEVEALLSGCVTCTEDMNACVNLDWMQAFATAVVEKLCGEPVAWQVVWPGKAATETWHSVFVNERDALHSAEQHDGAVVTPLYALNRSKA
ncbi:hypothetical protein ACV22V_08185 [Burkholderia sp. AW33-5]